MPVRRHDSILRESERQPFEVLMSDYEGGLISAAVEYPIARRGRGD
jgi:hypothetical protein